MVSAKEHDALYVPNKSFGPMQLMNVAESLR